MRMFNIEKTTLPTPNGMIVCHLLKIATAFLNKYPNKKNAIAIGTKFNFHKSHLLPTKTHRTRHIMMVAIEIQVRLYNFNNMNNTSVINKTNRNHIGGFHVKLPFMTNSSSIRFIKSLLCKKPIIAERTFQATKGSNNLRQHFASILLVLCFTEKRKGTYERNICIAQ